jgi:hypothetical protein
MRLTVPNDVSARMSGRLVSFDIEIFLPARRLFRRRH